MTVIYIPRLIESAEQAEQLPEGAVLIREGHFAFQKYKGRFVSADPHDLPVGAAWEVIGWTALVPIEAEEETREHPRRHEKAPRTGEAYLRPATMTRLVTPWEEA